MFACNGSLLTLLDRALVHGSKSVDPRLSDIETVFVPPAPGYSVGASARRYRVPCATLAAVPVAQVATEVLDGGTAYG